MWQLDIKVGWTLKNSCFWIVVLEKTLESPLDSKIKPVNPKGNQTWVFIGRTDAEAEAPVLWLPDAKNWLIGKDLDAGKDFSQKEKGMTEYEMVGWHNRINGHEFEQTLGDSETQASLVWCSPCGGRESDKIEWLNNNNKRPSGFDGLIWYVISRLIYVAANGSNSLFFFLSNIPLCICPSLSIHLSINI